MKCAMMVVTQAEMDAAQIASLKQHTFAMILSLMRATVQNAWISAIYAAIITHALTAHNIIFLTQLLEHASLTVLLFLFVVFALWLPSI